MNIEMAVVDNRAFRYILDGEPLLVKGISPLHQRWALSPPPIQLAVCCITSSPILPVEDKHLVGIQVEFLDYENLLK
jgi:hypothetical protein